MQGTWKEKFTKLDKYDRKGNRRKIQKRKHTLKDKAKWFIRHSDDNFRYKHKNNKKHKFKYPIYSENNVEYYKLIKNKREFLLDVYLIYVNKNIQVLDGCGLHYDIDNKGKTIVVFQYKNTLFDIYTKKPLFNNNDKRIKYIRKVDQIYVEWDKDIPKYKNKKISRYFCCYENKIFIYGKPINSNYYNQYGFYSSKMRKFWQNKYHKSTRQYVKNWLKKEFYSDEAYKPIKQHQGEKSINWIVF